MKLGLVYRDDPASAAHPLNETVFQVCRPDFVSLEVGTVTELRTRILEARRLKLRVNWILPVEKLSGLSITMMGRVLNDEARQVTHRVTLGARPYIRSLTPVDFLTKVVRGLTELVAVPVALGVGDLLGGYGGEDWLTGVLVRVASSPVLSDPIRDVAVAVYPDGALTRRQASRLAARVQAGRPGARLHVETGWRLGIPVRRSDVWRAFWRGWPVSAPAVDAVPELDAPLRDAWLVDAWRLWTAVGASSVALFGYVEHASAGAWNLVGDDSAPVSSWSSIRLTSAIQASAAPAE